MKKRFLSVFLILVMVFSLAGCAGKEETKSEDTTTTKEQETTTEAELSKLEAWYEENKENLKDTEDALTESYEDLATVTLRAEENTLIYNIVINDDTYSNVTEEQWVSSFSKAVNQYIYTYEIGAQELTKGFDVGEVFVRVEVYKKDGSLLYAFDTATDEEFIKEGVNYDPTKIEKEKDSNSTAVYSNLEEWYEDNLAEVEGAEEELNQATVELGYTVEVYVEGNTWVYCNTFGKTIDVSDPAMQQQVNEMFDGDMAQKAAQYDEFKESLAASTGLNKDDIGIRVIWYNSDGSLMYDSEHE